MAARCVRFLLLLLPPCFDAKQLRVKSSIYDCQSVLETFVAGLHLDDAQSEVRKHTSLTQQRLRDAGRLWIDAIARGLDGDWIETGVWRGGTSLLAALIARASESAPECQKRSMTRTVWLADSFQGLPTATALDTRMGQGQRGGGFGGKSRMDPAGSYAVSIEAVAALFRDQAFAEVTSPSTFRELRSASGQTRVRLLKGWFNETLPKAPIGALAVLRLDGDLYTSTMDAIVPLYPKYAPTLPLPLYALSHMRHRLTAARCRCCYVLCGYGRLTPSGFLIIDDYGHWLHCKRAIDDYFDTQGWMPALMHSDYTGRWMQKPQRAPGLGADPPRISAK
jgi:hypothetical protein